jgi:hypothetical protein
MANEQSDTNQDIKLEGGTYEIIRERLQKQGNELRDRLGKLNTARKDVFGSIDTKLVATERINTDNNCIARDIVPLGNNRFLFGYNVHIGLKTETHVKDVFSYYNYDSEKHEFHKQSASFLNHEQFKIDFANLYQYYRGTTFAKFAEIGQHVFMVFRVGKDASDIKTFKWAKKEGELIYLDNRSDHEFQFPNQHEFQWVKATRDMQRKGLHPHYSIEDRVFVETTEGDLTIKVENNTDSGKGIYSESVEDPDQTLDDADIQYAIIGNLIALKIKPYREKKYRYIVYNEKIQQAVRMDALEDSCVLLPDDQGIIFAKGYYIQTGEVKLFDNQLENMLFERRVPSPNGEDFMYVFYQQGTGVYSLLSYNIIEQEVETPIICNGYSFFDDGEMLFFKSEEEQKRHHVLQIWQTPYYSPNKTIEIVNKSYLFKLGNKEVVRAMAESQELIKLINKEDSYANLYIDLVKIATDIMDSYHWVAHEEAFNIKAPLQQVKETASTAIEEYEKVLRIKKNTREKSQEITGRADEIISRSNRGESANINEFVERLGQLRTSRGEIISMKDLRYVNLELIDSYEKKLIEVTDNVSQLTVKFLLKKEALNSYDERVEKLSAQLEKLDKVVDAKKLETEIVKVSKELEMLIEIVSNLKIEDATHTTRIIDSISAIYSRFNRINAALKKKRKELVGKEGEAEFNAQLKLVNQGLTNYLDISDTPEKCDEYLNKLMVQLEELEGRFAEFESFLSKITEKREEVYNAFESKKVYLTEARNKKSLSLQQSAERIISGIQKRLAGLKTAQEINAYYASDLMVDKVRDLANQLLEMGDSVKADDLQSKLKSSYEEASRQLKDKKELFVDGTDVIKFGKHAFNVNTQTVELSLVNRNGDMFYHITGTNFFEPIRSAEFEAAKELWEQSLPSENQRVYRGEFLAFSLFRESMNRFQHNDTEIQSLEELHQMSNKALQGYVQRRMALRYDEGYVKGVHDKDAMLILQAILGLYSSIGLMRYSANSRVLAFLYWNHLLDVRKRNQWQQHFQSVKSILKVFPESQSFAGTMQDLEASIDQCTEDVAWKTERLTSEAASFLFHFLCEDATFTFSREAWDFSESFQSHLRKSRSHKDFEISIKNVGDHFSDQFEVVKNWLRSYNQIIEQKVEEDELREAGVILLSKTTLSNTENKLSLHVDIDELRGDHPLIVDSKYNLHYGAFMEKLINYAETDLVRYRSFVALKKELLVEKRKEIRLNEFKPRVLTSFVRNRLINEVYLPLIGDNLAKQMGAAGSEKRTDLMGLLLLISPPGYGKTTLMEYIANRLGLVFMKINGPAIGHEVTALDPVSANNSAARVELEKLNLAFEMGDNVMIYVDDIQHCNPEFLQKFISLCDAQRKVEGVYKGESKTYDFRGKKVAVVMAGNPYTESGEKFRIPDMLANRADIYNLGDIIGGKATAFELSYIENSITSNSVISRLNGQSQKDIQTLIKVAEGGDQASVEFESNYSPEEVNEYVNLLQKMIVVRDIILKVNESYIYSAGQADEFRTEPPFRLQGSYRNMNKIVEKLSPVMNDDELRTTVLSHYENESQTLTTGAEFNFLKFKEMFEEAAEDDKARKASIIETFQRNQKLQGLGGNQMGHVLEQMELMSKGLQDIASAFQKRRES